MQQTGIEEFLHNDREAPDAVEVDHVEAPVGLHVSHVRYRLADAVEVFQRQLDLGLVGDGQQVEHRVGRTSQRHHHGDGVFERLLGHDLAGPDARFEQARPPSGPTRRRNRRACGRQRGHVELVGRAIPRASAAEAIVLAVNMPAQLPSVGHARCSMRASSSSVNFPAARAPTASKTLTMSSASPWAPRPGSMVPPYRNTEGRLRRAAAMSIPGSDLSHPAKRHQGVEPFGVHHRFDRVGNDLPADQRRPHPFGPHRDAVRDGDGDELQGKPAGVADALLGPLGQPVQRQVAGRDLVPGRSHAHLGLVPVRVGHPDGPEHGPGRGPFGPVGDFVAAWFEVARHMDTLKTFAEVAEGRDSGRSPRPLSSLVAFQRQGLTGARHAGRRTRVGHRRGRAPVALGRALTATLAVVAIGGVSPAALFPLTARCRSAGIEAKIAADLARTYKVVPPHGPLPGRSP